MENTNSLHENDFSHLVSEKSLAKDWLSEEEIGGILSCKNELPLRLIHQ